MSYREIMDRAIGSILFEPWDEQTRQQIEYEFRSQCPGNYQVYWYEQFDENFMPKYELWFDSETEAVIWYLKWS